MSVIIKGMKMPSNCHECPVLYVTSICDGSKDCPLVELPAQHVRLIDAYELAIEILKLQKYRFSIEDPEIFVSRRAVMQAISDNPTIIEAEGEP